MRAQYFHHIPPKSPHFLVCTSSAPVHARVVHTMGGSGGSGGMAGMSDPMASLDQGPASAPAGALGPGHGHPGDLLTGRFLPLIYPSHLIYSAMVPD